MILPVTLTSAGLAAIINLWLAMRVGQVRTREKVLIGDGGNEHVIRRMRAHANFVEFTPFILLLIGVIELAVGTSLWLWAAALIFLAGRILHMFGMDGFVPGRMIGTIITMLSLAGLGGYAVYLAYSSGGTMTQVSPMAPETVTETVPEG